MVPNYQNRIVLIVMAGITVALMNPYMYWISLTQRKEDMLIHRNISSTLEQLNLLEQLNREFGSIKNTLMDLKAEQSLCNKNIIELATTPSVLISASTSDFAVDDRGFWEGLGATRNHVFDESLANAIIHFLKREKVLSILELGAGTGAYAKLIMAEGFSISCYDGNPNTQEVSEGRCAIIDLSRPVEFVKHDWVMSLEVGEHIPAEHEKIFISNLDRLNHHGMILSWAVEGQGGTSHVNNRNNAYIRKQVEDLGYHSDLYVEKQLRSSAVLSWFKNTIMVFRKNA